MPFSVQIYTIGLAIRVRVVFVYGLQFNLFHILFLLICDVVNGALTGWL